MSQTTGDLRVRRTQKLIREAFIALIEEHGFDAITVGEIASRAMVSRTAFYRYYQDKYDLVEKIFAETMSTVVSGLGFYRRNVIDSFEPRPKPEPWVQYFERAEKTLPVPQPLVHVFEHVTAYESLYRALLGKKGSSWFRTKMQTYLAAMTGERLQELAESLSEKPTAQSPIFADGFVAALIAAQFVDAIAWWLEQGRPYTPRQIATYCYRMMCSILKDASSWE